MNKDIKKSAADSTKTDSSKKKKLKLDIGTGYGRKLSAEDLEKVAGGAPSSVGTTNHCETNAE